LVKIVTIDIAISVRVIAPRSFIVIVESLAFTMRVPLRFTFAYLYAMRVRMSFEFGSISRDI